MSRAETIHFLRNSKKGQIRYDTGWDEKPFAVSQLISVAQNIEDGRKKDVLERTACAYMLSESRKLDAEYESGETSSEGTSSGSGSRLTLLDLENSFDAADVPHNHSNDKTSSHNHQGHSRRKKGYGIRDEDYEDDLKLWKEMQATEKIHHIQSYLARSDVETREVAEQRAAKKREEIVENLAKRLSSVDVCDAVKQIDPSRRSADFRKSVEQQCLAETEVLERARKAENEALELEFQMNKQHLREKKAQERMAAEARAVALKAAEERERIRKEHEKKAAEDAAAAAAEKEKQRKDEEVEIARRLEEKLQQQAADAQAAKQKAAKEASLAVASDLQGLIFKEDCEKYSKCNELISQFEQATSGINASSDNPTVKKFYKDASKCINTPLNAIANTDPGQISAKINLFINMIEGKPVSVSSTMTNTFSSTELPNGKAFVLRLLAFRFVKKADAEILSEKKGFGPLAQIALHLGKRFPEWASLVQAYFYKLCPFLLPFNMPRGNQSLQEYCDSLGYNLQGSESTLLNEMLGRVKGYCSMYAIMIMTYEKSGAFDIGPATSFFTLGNVWEVLCKTMKLEPQPDVTVVVLHTLLDLLADRLSQVYGNQFGKLMSIMVTIYLPKIDKISTGPSQSGVSRFKTFLEQKFRVR